MDLPSAIAREIHDLRENYLRRGKEPPPWSEDYTREAIRMLRRKGLYTQLLTQPIIESIAPTPASSPAPPDDKEKEELKQKLVSLEKQIHDRDIVLQEMKERTEADLQMLTTRKTRTAEISRHMLKQMKSHLEELEQTDREQSQLDSEVSLLERKAVEEEPSPPSPPSPPDEPINPSIINKAPPEIVIPPLVLPTKPTSKPPQKRIVVAPKKTSLPARKWK